MLGGLLKPREDRKLTEEEPPLEGQRLRKTGMCMVLKLGLDASDKCQLAVQQCLHRRLPAPPMHKDCGELEFAVLDVAEAEQGVARAEEEEAYAMLWRE